MTDEMTDPVAALQDLRQRLYAGEEISPEEYEQVLTALRAGRRAGAESGGKGKKRTPAPSNIDTNALLQGLSKKASSTAKEE